MTFLRSYLSEQKIHLGEKPVLSSLYSGQIMNENIKETLRHCTGWGMHLSWLNVKCPWGSEWLLRDLAYLMMSDLDGLTMFWITGR